ncbi:DUF1330 domain-containing protein [Roseibium aggregatum]|uniref:DUF1330 domain-containing protein n=1 Tax=Roseibium aggregatum TaxID=187304 RepID=A0A939EDD7_9HYPH|nr:DUF1330 domain-containing protein [Roseibium aggregatum]MBN9670908.1 DUF1330 domain-containing protein [Roseibium aggregatum]
MDVNQQIAQFTEWYGPGNDGNCPTGSQWTRILNRSPEQPLTLINFFKFRGKAAYEDKTPEVSGQQAFSDYAAVSLPAMQRAGGKFLFVGPYQGMFLGDDEDWDLVAIGAYPNLKSFMALYSDDHYRRAFHHRTAACERQKVMICGE